MTTPTDNTTPEQLPTPEEITPEQRVAGANFINRLRQMAGLDWDELALFLANDPKTLAKVKKNLGGKTE
jgi:hypothetical protein